MKTIEQLKDLAKELNGHGVLKFKVINNKYGTGIRVIGAWGRYGGFGFKTKTNRSGNYRGKLQGFGRTDEEFVSELKEDIEEILKNLVKDYKESKYPSLHSPKFVAVMEQYIKNKSI